MVWITGSELYDLLKDYQLLNSNIGWETVKAKFAGFNTHKVIRAASLLVRGALTYLNKV